MHHTRPKKIADKIIIGHQSLHTKLVVRFVILSCLKKNALFVGAEKPIITNTGKAINVTILKERGNHLFSRSELIFFNMIKIIFQDYLEFAEKPIFNDNIVTAGELIFNDNGR